MKVSAGLLNTRCLNFLVNLAVTRVSLNKSKGIIRQRWFTKMKIFLMIVGRMWIIAASFWLKISGICLRIVSSRCRLRYALIARIAFGNSRELHCTRRMISRKLIWSKVFLICLINHTIRWWTLKSNRVLLTSFRRAATLPTWIRLKLVFKMQWDGPRDFVTNRARRRVDRYRYQVLFTQMSITGSRRQIPRLQMRPCFFKDLMIREKSKWNT